MREGRFGIKPILIVGVASLLWLAASAAGAVTLTVHDYTAGDGPAGLVSNGIPFSPGVLNNESQLRLMDGATEVPIAVTVLARWHGDNSIRVVLLQFDASFAGATKAYSLDVGVPRTVADLPLTTVTWDLPKKIATLPVNWLCDSKVVWEQPPLGSTSFTSWEAKQLSAYNRIDFDSASLSACANSDHFYNAIHTSYQLYARTGDVDHLVNGRRWALHHARDQIHLSGDRIGHGICSQWQRTRYTYIQGLVDDYLFWGGDETLDVAGIIADNFYMTHPDRYYYVAPGVRNGFWSERESAFSVIGLVAYYEATGDVTYLNKATERIDALHQMQSDNGGAAFVHSLYDHDSSECGDPNSFGVSPWMTGLLLEGIIKYHKLTGYAKARESVLWAIDHLKNNCLATGDYAGKSFIYMCGCATESYVDGLPDLDNMTSHAFAYGFKLTGNQAYKDIAMDLIDTAANNAFTGSAKHYNQQFRSSGHAVAYLSEQVPTLLAGFWAEYAPSGVSVSWDLSEEGIDMRFFVSRREATDDYFVELDNPHIEADGLSYRFTDTEVEPGRRYRYRVEVIDEDERRILFQTAAVEVPALSVAIQNVYPNPFNPEATITYTVSEASPVRLRVYDTSGRVVRTLESSRVSAGKHSETWRGINDRGESVASGVYYVRLETQGRVQSRKLVLIK